MLKGISPLISPELLKVLCEMGHGDEIVLADANFPAESMGQRVVRADGIGAADLLRVLSESLPSRAVFAAAAPHIAQGLQAPDAPHRKAALAAVAVLADACAVAMRPHLPQLVAHAKGNMNLGNDSDFLKRVVSQCVPYIGYPRSLNAIACVDKAAQA